MSYLTALATAAIATAVPATPEVNAHAQMMKSLGGKGLSGGQLERAIAKAEVHPLGSKDNPIRADMPEGQRAYLSRLRCADGQAPAFMRTGNLGVGTYGYIVDNYSVTCAGAAPVNLIFDMYHRHVEQRAVPGFTIVSEQAPAPPAEPAVPQAAPAEPIA